MKKKKKEKIKEAESMTYTDFHCPYCKKFNSTEEMSDLVECAECGKTVKLI